jgi:hypothetical protein
LFPVFWCLSGILLFYFLSHLSVRKPPILFPVSSLCSQTTYSVSCLISLFQYSCSVSCTPHSFPCTQPPVLFPVPLTHFPVRNPAVPEPTATTQFNIRCSDHEEWNIDRYYHSSLSPTYLPWPYLYLVYSYYQYYTVLLIAANWTSVLQCVIFSSYKIRSLPAPLWNLFWYSDIIPHTFVHKLLKTYPWISFQWPCVTFLYRASSWNTWYFISI